MLETLLLVPTKFELESIQHAIEPHANIEARICGFGLVESTCTTMLNIRETRPTEVVLCGIVGSFGRESIGLGETVCFDSVSQYGIGSVHEQYSLPTELGFQDPGTQAFPLNTTGTVRCAGSLVSVTCAGMFSRDEILKKYPSAVAEDMEGYGVAVAASKFNIPLTVIRSISNVVGQPFGDWEIKPALAALGTALASYFSRKS